MQRTHTKWMASIVAVIAAGGALYGARDARGQGSQIGELGAGGTAQGDISLSAGEEDRIGIDLAAGSALDVKLTSAFAADLALLAPNDADTGASFGTATTKSLTAWPVTSTGRYHLVVRSADGTQGLYTLTAQPKWATKVTLSGSMGGSVSVGLPAGASVKGTISSMPAGTFDPRIMSFMAPGGVDLLSAPVTGSKGIARVSKIATTVAGMHSITVDGGTSGGQFQAALSVKAKKVKPTKVDLRNGLTQVSFAKDGVGQMLTAHGCVGCHTWASSAAGMKVYATRALPRIQSGQMPLGGARLSAAEVALFQQWIATGMAP